MRLRFFVLTLLFSISASAFARQEPTFSNPTQAISVAIADWAGLLQLPKPEERREDGGVWFQVFEAPADHQDLIGQRIWLKWNERDPIKKAKYRARFIDVQFCDEATKQLSTSPPPVMRERVNGWKLVSPLESLAASHAVDDVIASFSNEEISMADASANTIEASTEPVVVSGPRESVVRFKEKPSPTKFLVETVSAEPVSFEVNLIFPAKWPTPGFEEINTDKFLDSPLNKKGWIVQGFTNVNGGLDILAASPYELYTVERAEFAALTDKKDFLKNRLWDMSAPNGTLQKEMVGPTDYKFDEAAEYLLLHAYGYYDNYGTILGLNRGHASIGWAKVVRNKFTNELTLRPGNWQVYYNSPHGVMSCKYDEVSYAGDFIRGKGYYRPISDIFIPTSSLNGKNRVWDTYAKNFIDEAMLDNFANTRVGYGSGYVMETMITSCVHDSANILISTIEHALGDISEEDPTYSLYRDVRKSLGKYVKIPSSYRTCGKVQRWHGLTRGIENPRSVIPRRFHDAAVKGFLRGGAPVINIKSLMITQEGTSMKKTAPYPIKLSDMIQRALSMPFTKDY